MTPARNGMWRRSCCFLATLIRYHGRLRRTSSMRLGIVSDTHGHVQNTLDAVRMLESLDVDEVLHCGDIGSTEIPGLFAQWPTHFVLGNCDPDAGPLSMAISSAGLMYHKRFGD